MDLIYSKPFVIGVDTGLSSGLATIRGIQVVSIWQGPPEHVSNIFTQMVMSCLNGGTVNDRGRMPLIAAERFIRRPEQHGNIRTNQGDAEQLLGVVMDLAKRYSCKVVFQQPSSVKKMVPNRML